MSTDSLQSSRTHQFLQYSEKSNFTEAAAYLSLLFNTTTNFLKELYTLHPLFPDVIQPLALSFHMTLEGLLSSLRIFSLPNRTIPSVSSRNQLLGHPSVIPFTHSSSSVVDRYLWQCEWFNRLLQLNSVLTPETQLFSSVLIEVRGDQCETY